MLKKWLLGIFVCSCFLASGQTVFQPKPLTDSKKGVIYERELTFDFSLHTNGYQVGVSWGKIATFYKTNFYYVGIGEIKHPKEFRQNFRDINPVTNQTSNSFVFGKQNNFILLRGGKGFKKYYSEKAKEKGVAVAMVLEGGPTLGLIKPYYLDVRMFSDRGTLESIKYDPSNADVFLNPTRIFGSSGFARGLDEISLIPGLHGKIAANFEWGAYDEFIKSAEVGLMLDIFPRKVPIMVSDTNRAFFLNLFATLQLGRRS